MRALLATLTVAAATVSSVLAATEPALALPYLLLAVSQ